MGNGEGVKGEKARSEFKFQPPTEHFNIHLRVKREDREGVSWINCGGIGRGGGVGGSPLLVCCGGLGFGR